MWFDAQAALQGLGGAESPRSELAAPAKPARPTVANVADVAGGAVENSNTSLRAIEPETTSPYGASVGGRLLTYTGRVVSRATWRNLSDWERHGPRSGSGTDLKDIPATEGESKQ